MVRLALKHCPVRADSDGFSGDALLNSLTNRASVRHRELILFSHLNQFLGFDLRFLVVWLVPSACPAYGVVAFRCKISPESPLSTSL